MEPFQMDNGKWTYNFMFQGKRYRKQGKRTKTEAKSRIRNILSDAAKGVDANSDERFADYFEKWIEVNKSVMVEDKTYQRFISTLDKIKYFLPEDTRLKDLNQLTYQEFINYYADGLAKDTISKIHQAIKAALEDAVYNGLIPRNLTYRAHIWGTVPEKEEKYKYMHMDQYIKAKKYFKSLNYPSGLLLFILHITGGRFS